MELEEKSNNEILFEVKQMQADYEAIKMQIYDKLDAMDELENKYNKANEILLRRLKTNEE